MGVLRLDGFNWKACLRTTGIDGFDFDLMMERQFSLLNESCSHKKV